MVEANTLTKAQLLAALTPLDVVLPRKATHAQLCELYNTHCVAPAPAPAPAATPTKGTGLKIEKQRPEQNGIKQPSAGGKCRAVWDALTALAAGNVAGVTAEQVKQLAAQHGWNPNNASIEFYQWRKFNGVTGRAPKADVAAAAATLD